MLGDFSFWSLFVALTLFGLWPVWATDLLPVVDAGSHLQLIKILHEWKASPLLQKHYIAVHAIVPYLSYYQIVSWVAHACPIEVANKIVLSVCLLALPLSALSLLRAAGHSRWLAFAVVPWMLNADFIMGFFNFLMSIPLFLWLLAHHVRFLRNPTWARAAALAGLLAAMAITHYLLWSVALALLPTLAVIFGVRHGLKRAVWWPIRDAMLGLPSVGLLLPWFLSYFVFAEGAVTSDVYGRPTGTFVERLKQLYSGEHFGPMDNLRQILDCTFDRLTPTGAPNHLLSQPGQLLATLWIAGMALWAFAAACAPNEPPPVDPVRRRWGPIAVAGTSYTGWTLLLVTVAYFLLPRHLLKPIWLWGVNFRLVEVLAVLAVCALPLHPLRPPVGWRGRVALGGLCLLLAAMLAPILTTGQFLLARTEFGSIRPALASIPKNKKVLVLRRKFDSRFVRATLFNNVPEYYAVLVGGYVPYSFADTSSKPFVVDKKTQLPAPQWDWHDSFTWQQHGRYYDFIGVFGEPGAPQGEYDRQLAAQNLPVVYRKDMWTIYKNPEPAPWP
ncbi:MAG: hypothetical protein FJ100_20990 [Deltaproteobacteria bacterium]|nr:hypothetical protein [Deltaproteobacteria bacterium]